MEQQTVVVISDTLTLAKLIALYVITHARVVRFNRNSVLHAQIPLLGFLIIMQNPAFARINTLIKG
jgi:hypothetical protein